MIKRSAVDEKYDQFLKRHKDDSQSVFESMAAHELQRMIYDAYGDPDELALWEAQNAAHKERYDREHNTEQ